ncbi:ubiquitin fusion degradation protein UFD1-domain-containing protein [Jimgerdemannia flammicorona]|uniref:Ubiquitin fusion degradation protein UFD1-domain-containing protein n=1 Tax=Jimgerdemannia flammicorona TaxID=994334 RepID=A0A433D4J0_9FUNG|nr:ubiquitin fusion degradation protein UFD1-domain-containing protein [Jimgerdemannia flammicorona]
MSILSWSKSLRVGPLRSALDAGDKILLPPSVLEEFMAATGTPAQPYPDPFESYMPRIATPPPHQSRPTLPSPLTFQILNPKTRFINHGGVKEFSSDEGICHLPAWMLNSLDLKEGDTITLRLKELPKGTWARFRSMSANSRDILDFRAVFESHLRANYNTLTKGDILSVRHGNKRYEFLVEELKPADAVCVTDTDLEVDIEPLAEEAVAAASMAPNGRGVVGGLLDKQVVVVGEVAAGNVEEGEYRYFRLKDIDHGQGQGLRIKIAVESGDIDLLISSDPHPTLTSHIWSSLTTTPTHQVHVPPTDTSFATITDLHIGVHAFKGPAAFTLSTSYASVSDPNVPHTLSSSSVDPNANQPGYSRCANCGSWVPERTIALHEGFCARNNIKCEKCEKVMKKGSEEAERHWHCDICDKSGDISEKDKHIDHFHMPRDCSCGTLTESYPVLALHRRTTCPDRLIMCRYCHNLLPQGDPPTNAHDILAGLHAHESYCGSRTIVCHKCGQPIPIKDVAMHARVHDAERQRRTTPPLCSNMVCVRQAAAAPHNVLRLCQTCFGPFWVPGEDQGHMKLLQTVARRIHLQLTTGCGNKWCRNKNCATSTGTPQEANMAASTLIPLITSLRQALASGSRPELYLCVDEATTRRRFLAEVLEQDLAGKYAIEWCVKGLEAEREDLDRAKTWVEGNAPRK